MADPAQDPLGAALAACPFLGRVASSKGESYARGLAAHPFADASTAPLLLEEGLSGLAATLRLFHGPAGVVPLKRFASTGGDPASSSAAAAAGCPYHAAQAATSASGDCSSSTAAAAAPPAAPAARCGDAAVARPAAARSAFASISLSGFGFVPDPSQLFNRRPRAKPKQQRSQQQQQQQQHKPADAGSSHAGGGAGASNPAGSAGGGRLQRPAPRGGWGEALGGLLPLAAGGHLACPTPIVKMRAAIAALKPVRDLRPQALPVRALAMGGTAIAAALPCGMWREHTRKFSPQWFLAVHATIPFVAMLRKAVLMPKWAILLTIAGSIAGQNVGARLERERLRQLASQGQQAGAAGAMRGGGASGAPPAPAPDCVMPGLDASCRRCLQAAQAAVAWTLAPTVVP